MNLRVFFFLWILAATGYYLFKHTGSTETTAANCDDNAPHTAEAIEKAQLDGPDPRCKPARESAAKNNGDTSARTPPATASTEEGNSFGVKTLAEARAGFQTEVADTEHPGTPLPNPPSSQYVRMDYTSGDLSLPAFVTPEPRDGGKHPAIVWMTGGDSSTLDEFWTPGASDAAKAMKPFLDAGFVVMLPTLRGGNENPGAREYFLGEVDDVIAAGEALAGLSYVDPARIYMGGHSTGGTLALLVAESTHPFKAVFAFGPVARVDYYPSSIVPVDFGRLAALEADIRAPVNWLAGLRRPTFVIEGAGGNKSDALDLCKPPRNPVLRCVLAEGLNHFTVLPVMTSELARQLSANPPGFEYVMHLPGELPVK